MKTNTSSKRKQVATKQAPAPKKIKATNVVSPESWTVDKIYTTELSQPGWPEFLQVKNDNGKVISVYQWDTTKRHLNNFVEVK